MNYDEIIDADFPEAHDFEDPRDTEARAKPGANFESVYGQAVYSDAMSELRAVSKRYGYSERDEDAYWPVALMRAMGTRSVDGRKHGVKGTPTGDEVKTAKARSESFLTAWKAMTGNDMRGGLLSEHVRIKLSATVPWASLSQAQELRDEGVCSYVQKVLELGRDFRNGERDRGDLQRGRPPKEMKGLQRVRERCIGD